MMTWIRNALLLLAVTSHLGCPAAGRALGGSASGSASVGVSATTGGQPESTAAVVNAITDAAHPGIEACAAGDVEANLAIGTAFEDSMHELVVCGGMAARFSLSFVNIFVNLARQKPGRPGGFVHLGGGKYKVGDVMEVTATTPFATSFAAAGEPIPFDVFDLQNYFGKATITISATATLGGKAESDMKFSVQDPKPGLELLGDVAASGQFSISWKQMLERLGAIGVTQDIHVEDTKGDAVVVWDATSSSVPARNFLFAVGGGADIQINGATVTNEKLGQTLTVTDFSMNFSGGSAGTMDGQVSFEVRGGDFDWSGTFTYPHRKAPDVKIACLPKAEGAQPEQAPAGAP